MNFVEAAELINVALYGCHPPSLIIPVPPPPPPLPPPPSQRPDTAIGLNGSDTSFIALVVSEEEVLRGCVHKPSIIYITSTSIFCILTLNVVDMPSFVCQYMYVVSGSHLVTNHNLPCNMHNFVSILITSLQVFHCT